MGRNYTPRLRTRYRDEIRGKMQEELSYENVTQIPGITEVVVSMSAGAAAQDKKQINGAISDLILTAGQRPETRRARKSITNFKLREGDAIGAYVTLRGDRIWELLNRLLIMALPRVRDFRGLSDQQLDGHGNYTFGLSEQTMFYEIDVDKTDHPCDMDITAVTTATSNEEGRALLRKLGFPFKE